MFVSFRVDEVEHDLILGYFFCLLPLMFVERRILHLGILGDTGVHNVIEDGSLVDAVSGLLNVPIGFFFVSDTISISVMSTGSTFKLVTMGDECLEIFSLFLTVETFVYFSCIFLHDDDKYPVYLQIKQVTVSSVRNILKLVLLRLITREEESLS
jgi:hypothetical protein